MKKSMLTLVKEKAKRHPKSNTWMNEYKCECGNTTFQYAHNVNGGIVNSCGCQRWKIKNTIPKDSQLVLSRNRIKSIDGSWHSEYTCSCGNKKIMPDSLVRNGAIKSCGCRMLKNKRTIPSNSLLILIREKAKKKGKIWYGKYKCKCGKTRLIQDSHARSGQTRSCGCLIKLVGKSNRKHGMDGTRIYGIWVSMRRRCRNRKEYADRGITVCESWKKDFLPFYEWSMKNGYSNKLQIDRINNDGNYEPSNCRWTTVKVNSNNRRSSLSHNTIREIKSLLSHGFTPQRVREILGNCHAASHIRLIKNGKIHSDI